MLSRRAWKRWSCSSWASPALAGTVLATPRRPLGRVKVMVVALPGQVGGAAGDADVLATVSSCGADVLATVSSCGADVLATVSSCGADVLATMSSCGVDVVGMGLSCGADGPRGVTCQGRW